jgi:hypothetical protein
MHSRRKNAKENVRNRDRGTKAQREKNICAFATLSLF